MHIPVSTSTLYNVEFKVYQWSIIFSNIYATFSFEMNTHSESQIEFWTTKEDSY